MSVEYPYVGVDWGTSRMRAMLCRDPATRPCEADVIVGPGISKLETTPAETLFAAIGDWVDQFGTMDIILGGMVGSNIGWSETPYCQCPVDAEALRDGLNTFQQRGHQIAIVPGVACKNVHGLPDVMRGEEVQILGYLSTRAAGESRLLCLPGTHTKWVTVEDGRIVSFTTSLTGELFALLRQHSVLVARTERGDAGFDADSFDEGLEIARSFSGDFLQLVFSTRTRTLIGSDAGFHASSYLSGLLVGTDVARALENHPSCGSIALIGETGLCDKFAAALKKYGHDSETYDGNDAAYYGIQVIAAGKL